MDGSFLDCFQLLSLSLGKGIMPHRNTVLKHWTYNCAIVVKRWLLGRPALLSCFKKYNLFVAFLIISFLDFSGQPGIVSKLKRTFLNIAYFEMYYFGHAVHYEAVLLVSSFLSSSIPSFIHSFIHLSIYSINDPHRPSRHQQSAVWSIFPFISCVFYIVFLIRNIITISLSFWSS